MKIISKVHDYYDPVSSLGVSDAYYIRKPEVITSVDPLSRILSKTVCWGGSPGILFFCNQVFPLISIRSSCYKPEFFLVTKKEDFEIYKNLPKDGYSRKWVDLESSGWRYTNTYADQGFDQFIQDCSSLDPLPYHLKFKTPILWMTQGKSIQTPTGWQNQVNFHKDQVLKDIAFQKIKDAFTAYQEIDSFLSGVLGSDQKPLVEISDLDRLEGHGFDKKSSFRKSKG